MARLRIKSIQTLTRTYVDAAIIVSSDSQGHITGESLLRRVVGKSGALRFWMIHAHQSTTRRGQPKATDMVQVDVVDRPWWHAFRRGKKGKLAVVEARYASAESDTDIARLVFGKRMGQLIVERR